MSESALATTDMQYISTKDEVRMIGPQAVALRNIADVERFANLIYKSSLVPKDYRNNLGDVVGIIMFGLELGLNPMQALQNIAWINSKPSVYGDMLLALIEASGLLEGFDEASPDEALRDGVARCTVKRRGRQPITRTFTKDEAKTAKLWNKAGPWIDYPGRMLQMQARSWALRDAFSDVLKGLIAREEAQDIIDVTPTVQPASSTPPAVEPLTTDDGHTFLLEQIGAALKQAAPGATADDRDHRREILSKAFGVKAWSGLTALPVAELERGYQMLLTLVIPEGPITDGKVDMDDDVDLTPGPNALQSPETHESSVGDAIPEGEQVDASTAMVDGLQDNIGNSEVVETFPSEDGEIPQVEIDEDGFVTQPSVTLLVNRADAHGQKGLLRQIKGNDPGWVVEKFRYAWVQVAAKKTAKV